MSAIHHLDMPAAHNRRSHASVLQSVSAEGRVQGLLFELSMEQRYLNASDDNIEAVYTFPVPWNAVLLGVEVVLGEKVLQGTVIAKAEGERRYEAALEEGNSAVMVERASDGLYTVNVGNLLPREQAIVRFKYAQLLSFEQGQIRLVVPTVVGPRYGNPHAIGMQPHQVISNDLLINYPFSLRLTLHGEMAGAILSSPSHALSIRAEDTSMVLTLNEGAGLDRDVVVLAEGLAGKSVTTLGRDADGYVALASFCPQERKRSTDEPLNLKILVDCSGSMEGDRIDAARRALHDVLSHLEPADNFSFSRFGDDVDHFSASLMAATPRAIKKASEWVETTQADMGGTKLAEALLSTFALAQPFDADILLITDGDVWEADRLIASAERAGQRVFAVGIGSAPAASLLRTLTSRTGGACECVAAHTEIPGAILRMFKRMRQAPVRDVTIAWDNTPTWQTRPGRVVLSGETLHHFAGFIDHPPACATLHWTDQADLTAHRVDAVFGTLSIDGANLARMAAAARMPDSTPAERHALALQYALVSPTTNLILVYERSIDDKPADLPALRQVAHAMPAGSTMGSGRKVVSSCGPAVWRREGASPMFRLAETQETYDIPVFLRKQTSSSAYVYRDELRRFVESMALPTIQQGASTTPAALDDIAEQLPAHLVEALRSLVQAGFAEQDVVATFIRILAKQFRNDGVATRLLSLAQRWTTGLLETRSALEQDVERLVLDAFHAQT